MAQQSLREATRKVALNERTAQPLIERGVGHSDRVGKLAESLAAFPTTEPLVEEAKAAAFESVANLFEEKQESARLSSRSRVIGNLAQVEKVLEQGIDAEHSDKSADELAAEVERLKRCEINLPPRRSNRPKRPLRPGRIPARRPA